MKSHLLAAAVVAGLAASGGAARAAPPPSPSPSWPASLDAEVERARREFEIQAVGLAVVKDSQVVVARGYGVRRLGDPTPADEATLFAIASNTKAFTAAALGLLVQDGKLAWDDPVTRRLPSFQMYDPYVSRELTVRDLLTHRSGLGLGEGDLLYFPPSTFTPAEIVEKVRYLKPASSFRSRYAYDNILYIVAGEVVAAVGGTTWEAFVRDRLLRPLGMKDSVATASALPPGADLAAPHARVDGTIRPVPSDAADNLAAAGGIHASARDMARWVLALLEADHPSGRAATTRVLAPALVQEMWTPHTLMPIVDPPDALAALKPRFLSYGLGLSVRDYRGRKLLTHTGGLAGMVSRVTLVPEEGLGIVVLTNQESDGGRDAIAFRLLDHYLGAADTDWVGPFREAARIADEHTRDVEARQSAARARDSRPSLPLAAYAGRYRDAWYGEAAIETAGDHLVLRLARSPGLVGDLQHWQYDTFVSRWRDANVPAAFVTFALRPDGTVDQVKLAAVSPAADFSYDYQDLLFTPVRGK